MLISIIQPCFIPWLGYFEQMALADLFVYMDDVKYTRQNWRNNNKLLCASESKNVSIPVRKTSRHTLINQVSILNDLAWQNKFLNKVSNWYRKAPHFDEVFSLISGVVLKRHDMLVDLNYGLNGAIAEYVGIETPVELSSNVPRNSSDKVSRIIEIVKYFNADVLYDGKSAAYFIDIELFQEKGITIIFQDYKHSSYRQQSNSNFVPYMSIVDLLMNKGVESLGYILSSPLVSQLEPYRRKAMSPSVKISG
jgi:hypothetical protein